ncbi:MAG TPA: hypothetical protein PLR82_05305 [Bacillota bacterium]|nr:hypothetical protein [Bacillota bacterium]HQD86480.1 hypothetical protein [Bacillota bacterium]
MTRNERRCVVPGLIVVVPETERVNMEFDRKELVTLIAATCVYGWRLERGDDRSGRATERLMRANALCRRFHEALNQMDDHREDFSTVDVGVDVGMELVVVGEEVSCCNKQRGDQCMAEGRTCQCQDAHNGRDHTVLVHECHCTAGHSKCGARGGVPQRHHQ